MSDVVVVGVDGSTESQDAIDGAARLAKQGGARLVLLYVRSGGSLGAAGEVAASADAVIAAALDEAEAAARVQTSERLGSTGLDWRFEVVHGDPADELIHYAVEHGARAIIVGARAHGLVGGVILGSVSQKLVRQSPISVLVVRDGQAQRVDTTELAAT